MKSQTAKAAIVFKEPPVNLRGHRPPLQSEERQLDVEPAVEKCSVISSPKIALIWAVVALFALVMHIGGIELAKWLVGLVW